MKQASAGNIGSACPVVSEKNDGALEVEGEMTEAQEGTGGGVATSLSRASLPVCYRPAVTVPTGRCTGQAAELL